VNGPIRADLLGRLAKQLAMLLEARQEELGFIRIARQEAILGDQPAVHFAIPELAAKLSVMGFGFGATNNGGVRFKQAHHLAGGRDRQTFEYALPGLVDDLAH